MTNDLNLGRTPWRLAGVFVALVLGISIAGWFYYESQREHVKQETQSQLQAIASLKVAQISQWRDERIANGKSIAKNPFLVECISAIRANQKTSRIKTTLMRWMRSLGEHYGYERVELLNPAGKALVQEGTESRIGSNSRILLSDAVKSRDVVFSDLHRESFSDQVYCDVIVPIISAETHQTTVVAVVLLRIDASQFLYPLIQSWPTSSRSSEVLLVERDGDQVLYLNELRHLKNTPLMFRKPMNDLELLGVKAVSDSEGVAEGIDYRGVPVLGALKKIPSSPWRLIAKVDQEEVYAPIQARFQMIAIVVIALVVALGSSIGMAWKRQRSLFYRKTLELELKRKVIEEHFDALMKYANDGIVILDTDGLILDVNDKASTMYGWKRGDIVGQMAIEIVAPESREGFEGQIIQIQQSNGMVFESKHQRKDGFIFPVEVSARVITVDGKRLIQTIVRDISDRKTAERELRKAEQRFRSLIENANDLIVVTDPDGIVNFASPSVERILGHSTEELAKRSYVELIHPDDLTATAKVHRQVIENPGTMYTINHRLKRKDGSWLSLESYIKYVPQSEGKGEIIVNARDTEERNRALEALRLSEEKFSKAFLTSPDAISINKLKDGVFVEINDGFTNLTGHKKDEVIGKSSLEINIWAVPDDRKRFVRVLVRRGEVNDFDAEFLTKDGSKRTGLVSGKLMNVQGEQWILSITRDITGRKRAERILVENEERMRVALQGANIAVFNQDADLRYTWMYNPQLGYSTDAVIGKSDHELLPSPDVEKVIEIKRRVLSTGKGAHAEVSLAWQGERSHFDLTVEPLRNEKGDIVGITGATLDITNRKRAEEQLQLQKVYFQQLFESAPEAIVLLQTNEHIIQVNREFTKLFGYTQEDAIGREINDLIVPEMYKDEGLTLSRRVAQGSIISTESIRRRKDGSLVDVSILGRPVRVDGGQIALYAIYRDITERKKSEEALRKSESSFRGLFNSVNDAIYIQDREGRFVDVNQGAVNMYGYSREYLVGKYPSDVSAPGKNDLAKAAELVNKAFEGEPQQFEFWGVRKNGEIFPKEVRVSKGTYFGQEVVIALAQDITERKRFEAVLQETNRTLESLIKASPLAITVMDQECNIQLWNPAAERMFAWKADEVVGAFNPIVPEDKRDEFIELHNRALKGETIPEIEVRRRKRDGTLIDINRSTAIIRDADGNVKGIMAVLADITERKRAEEQLRESEERLRLALTGANMMSWELDLLHGAVTWSESAERFYGLKQNEFGGTREAFLQLIHPDDRSAVEQTINDSIRLGEEYKAEFRIVWPDSTVHWLATFGRASRDELGRPIKVSGIGVDITDRKRTEETIQKLHHAVEQTDEVIIMTEPDGIITYVNPAFEKLYRYSREEVIGKTPRVLKSGGMNHDYYAHFWSDLLAGKSVRSEHINKTKDGRIVIVEASVNSVYDAKGRLTGFIAVQEDISDRKRNEAERKRLEAQLLQTQKLESIGTLAGGIAHDFNNILGIILAYSALLRNARLPFEKIVNAADVINQAVERGAELVKQILTFARKTDVVYGLVNINGMIKELKTMLSETFPRTITIASELGGDVPEITADATQVHQAILNICVNARDAMPAGGKLILRTRAGTRSEVSSYFPEATSERYIRVSISDTGAGMDEGTRQRIFEPFFTTKAKGKGTGLGLSVVYGVVKNHNGFVRVDSEIGRGTTFHLYFPAPVRFVQTVEKTQGSLVDIPGGSESILIVEDEEPLLNVLSGLLKSKGYRVYVAHDGYEAVETYEEHHNDIAVVVSDLGLPKMTGQDAFLRMKSVNPRVKVIFGTGYLDPELKTELLNLGAKGFLAKPYSQDELLQRIRDLIDSGT
jgi:PAS domain S-box-containing protein